ncbi:translocation and assembly module lipoprotein TamL [Flavobacterium seoulense]|uniref:Membrane protein n=1 Tax=Flavobacterium seoulense TaxID=1492738 RepID=A0A066WME1_9FLAO|nr:BamA/TamA family outer membrane protein [Flavobacterium seoulense]KDN53758.1 membrane protein [Flavobacterium seoulense]
MKKISTKISLFILIGIIISACNAEKRVPDGKQLLLKNHILVNGKKTTDEDVHNQLYQKPNSTLLGYRLRLNLYNLAKLNPDSTYQAKFKNNPGKYERQAKWLSAKQVDRLGNSFLYSGIHDFLKRIGEPPVIIDSTRTQKSLTRLKYYYFNNGYFDVDISSKHDTVSLKRGKITYDVTTNKAYYLDSIRANISSREIDSLYGIAKKDALIESGKQYKTADFSDEKNRLSTYFRNHGAYYFQPTSIVFDIDTIGKKNKANVSVNIKDYSNQDSDSTKTEDFKLYKISRVDVYTDFLPNTSKQNITDSVSYQNFNLYSREKLRYKPHAITDAIFITKGASFADFRTTLTSRYLTNLKVFNPPSIQYEVDKKDTLQNSLIAKIYLTPRKKYSFGSSVDLTHSNIQDIGISFSPSMTIRNIFNGAETLEISTRANIGSSRDLANPNNQFFNVSEYGVDFKLNFPRIFLPFATERIIPKSMIPSTLIGVGYATQKNIGLDKENFTGTFSYNWNPKRYNTARFDLLNVQFVRNLNAPNYFNVYGSSYNALNEIAKKYPVNTDYIEDGDLVIERGTTGFIRDAIGGSLTLSDNDLQEVRGIEERRVRLTENDFILATNFSFTKTTKTDLADNDFYLFKTKIESAGSLLSLLTNLTNQKPNQNGNQELFNLEYSEYIKTEFDFIKHWDLRKEKVFAIRTFFGIAIPFGNSNYIPFSRSYFSGGSNDNRAWQPYSLGPGRSATTNDFNEANMKIAVSGEFRFKLLGDLKGALFADAGNIWNVFDNVTDEKAIFNNLASLKDIALGSGFGLRYDLNFFVVRFDFGFKTYNPADESGKKWFRDYNFGHTVLNFGINYPF